MEPDCYVKCGCGKKYTRDEYEALEHVGTQRIPAGESDEESWDEYDLEYRNCPCGSTICVEHPVIKFIEPKGGFNEFHKQVEELHQQMFAAVGLPGAMLK